MNPREQRRKAIAERVTPRVIDAADEIDFRAIRRDVISAVDDVEHNLRRAKRKAARDARKRNRKR